MNARGLRRDLAVALPAWLVARVLVGGAFVLAIVVVDELAGGNRPTELEHGLLSWDGAWYHDIARYGYGGVPLEGLRFFPLHPLLGKILSYPLLGNEGLGLIVVANALALVAGALLHRLALEETGDAALARRSAWYLALFPSAFVLVWGYSESLLLVASIGVFLALRRRWWWWAAGLGAVAGLSRPVGLLLVMPVAIVVAQDWRRGRRTDTGPRLAAVVGPLAGALLYLVYAWWRFDDFWEPISAQSQFRGDAVNPLSRLVDGVGDLFGSESFGDGLHLPFALAFVVLLVVVFRRWPLHYGVYAAVVLVVSLSADNLNSLERYGLNAFPLVLGLATLTADDRLDRGALVLSGTTLVALATLALVGAYVP